MTPRGSGTCYFVAWMVSLLTVALLLSSPVAAEPGQFIVSPIAEKKLDVLPPGPLYWRIENFPTLDQAQSAAAASPTSLAAAVSGATLGGPRGHVINENTARPGSEPLSDNQRRTRWPRRHRLNLNT
jgi:hypothetical protein